MRFLDQIKPPTAILGGIAPLIERVAHQGAPQLTVLIFDRGERQNLIHDPRQFEPGLAAINLRHVDLAIEVIEFFVEDPNKDDVLAARMLQMREPGDHLPAMQAIGAANIGLAAFF